MNMMGLGTLIATTRRVLNMLIKNAYRMNDLAGQMSLFTIVPNVKEPLPKQKADTKESKESKEGIAISKEEVAEKSFSKTLSGGQ